MHFVAFIQCQDGFLSGAISEALEPVEHLEKDSSTSVSSEAVIFSRPPCINHQEWETAKLVKRVRDFLAFKSWENTCSPAAPCDIFLKPRGLFPKGSKVPGFSRAGL